MHASNHVLQSFLHLEIDIFEYIQTVKLLFWSLFGMIDNLDHKIREFKE